MDQALSFWPSTAEGWSTLIANSIAIATFIFGRRAFIDWTISVRRAFEVLRLTTPGAGAPTDIQIAHAHIVAERPLSDGRWHVSWTLADGKPPRSAVAKITSMRLRWHLSRNPGVRDLLVFGEIRYVEMPDGPALVEVPAIDYITRGGMPKLFAKVLFG